MSQEKDDNNEKETIHIVLLRKIKMTFTFGLN
jgi:hypothetical protein